MRSVLTAICGSTMLASCWLFVMFLVLRHPGFEWRAGVSLVFAGVGALTLVGIRHPHPGFGLQLAIVSGAVALGVAGVWAMKTNVDEGFMDVISLALIAQATMTVTYFLVRQVRRVQGT